MENSPLGAAYRPAPFFETLAREQSGAPFFDRVEAARFPDHRLRFKNARAAKNVGLERLNDEQWVHHFGRFNPLPDNMPVPLATRYHGHQFRHYNPDIGDGRGFLFAQLFDDQNRLLDLGTKGSGTTPYSRSGDGRLTLKGAVREILATQMLEALGVNTSKTFCVVETGEELERQDEPSPTRSAVLTRLSHSHVRFGNFQRLAYEGDRDGVAALADYCVAQFYPSCKHDNTQQQIIGFYQAVLAASVRLAGQWMAAGFVHGVLNTDNMNVTGESFDYGPWRFNPTADPSFTAAYFDHHGLYAFGRQGEATAWNIAQLGGALSVVVEDFHLNRVLQSYPALYDAAMADAFFARLGLARTGADDVNFIASLVGWMIDTGAPYEQVFFDWFCGSASAQRAALSPISELYAQDKFSELRGQLANFEPVAPERLRHGYFAYDRPCTMLIDEVEAIWAKIDENDDWSGLEKKLTQIENMRLAYSGA